MIIALQLFNVKYHYSHRALLGVGSPILLASLTGWRQHKGRTIHVLVHAVGLVLWRKALWNLSQMITMIIPLYLDIHWLQISVCTWSWTKACQCLGVVVEVVWFHCLSVDWHTKLLEKMTGSWHLTWSCEYWWLSWSLAFTFNDHMKYWCVLIIKFWSAYLLLSTLSLDWLSEGILTVWYCQGCGCRGECRWSIWPAPCWTASAAPCCPHRSWRDRSCTILLLEALTLNPARI